MLNQCSNTGFSHGGRTFLGTMPVSWDDKAIGKWLSRMPAEAFVFLSDGTA